MSHGNHTHSRLLDEQTEAVLRCVGVLVSVVAIGTLGFHLLEPNWTFWDAFYFTLVTITTVGYGDYGISRESQFFAAVLLLCGIGTFTYSLSTLVQFASDVDAAVRRKMNSQIAKLNDHIIVCGYGRMGRMICSEIERGGLPLVVIDLDEKHVAQASKDGYLVVQGAASEDEVLLRVGVERARGVVCAVGCDAENMFVAVTVRNLNPDCRVISRAETAQAARKLEHAGASLVVSPHQMAGKSVATAFLHPRLSRCLQTGDDSAHYFELGEVVVEPGSEIAGQAIADFGRKADGVVFVAIERESGELLVQPRGDTVFHSGDVIIFAGSEHGMECMRSAAKRSARTPEPIGV